MHTNYHTVGFFLETEMIHFFTKMFSFLYSFLHFQVMRKCPILNTLSMTMEGLFWSILVKFILKKKSHVRLFWFLHKKSHVRMFWFLLRVRKETPEKGESCF